MSRHMEYSYADVENIQNQHFTQAGKFENSFRLGLQYFKTPMLLLV